VQLTVTIGIAVAYAAGLILPTGGYKDDPLTYWYIGMFLILGLVNLIQLILLKFVYNWESPVWLVENGDDVGALEVLNHYYTEE